MYSDIQSRVENDFEGLLSDLEKDEFGGCPESAIIINVVSGVLLKSDRDVILRRLQNQIQQYSNNAKEIEYYKIYTEQMKIIYDLIELSFELQYDENYVVGDKADLLYKIYFLLAYTAFGG